MGHCCGSTAKLAAMAAYGFVSGLPLPLSGFTFRLWLSDSGAGLAVVGLTAWIGLAYSLKFLWAPLLDQPPPLRALRRFGRRRGWLLLVQPTLGVAAVLLALSDPGGAPMLAFAAAACVALAVGDPGYRDRRMADRDVSAAPAGGGAGGLCLGLSGGSAGVHHRGDRACRPRPGGTRRCSAWRCWPAPGRW